MRKKNKLVYGIGVNDFEGNVYENGKPIKSYSTWKHMLERCYSEKLHSRNPTYIGCSVCDEWQSFSNFKKWFDGNYVEEFHLDKDIILEGNKIYSPEFCRFVPQYLNKLLTDSRNARGDLPLGVTECKPDHHPRKVNSTYRAFCNNGYGKLLSKTFKTVPEAVEWYAATKKLVVKEQAQRAFLDNSIKTDVYLALVRREW